MKTLVMLVCLMAMNSISCIQINAERQTSPPSSTSRFVLHSKYTNDDHVLRVWVPRSYQGNSQDYPLLLMLDGEYAFESAVSISDYLQRDGEVKEFIVAAVSYDVGFGKPLAVKRSRDFTPPLDTQRIISKTETSFHQFLKEELIPQLQSRYRIDPNDKTLWSYSLSGSFAIWLNYFDKSLFENYIMASPNCDYGITDKIISGAIFNSESTPSKRVLMSLDRSEFADKQYLEADAPRLSKPLREMIQGMKGYDFQFHLTEGESHTTSWFVALPLSLRFIFAPDNSKRAGV